MGVMVSPVGGINFEDAQPIHRLGEVKAGGVMVGTDSDESATNPPESKQ